MYKYKIANSLILFALFFSIALIANRHGKNNRVFASDKTVHTIDTPEKAYHIWKENNVRGRILILFDNYPHTIGYYAYKGLPQLNKSNLIEFSIFANIIRRIYYIVPETGWDDFRKQKFAKPIMELGSVAKGVYIYNQGGIPIIALPPSSLPQLDEVALVYINNKVFTTDQALTLLAQKKISSDIIISYESAAK